MPEELTYEDLIARGASPVEMEEERRPLTFGERVRLSFGGPEAISELKERETEAGLRGKFDIGDIADISGASLPILGGIAGSYFGPLGSAGGVGLGELARQAVGQAFGVGKIDVTEAGKEAAITYLGGKALKSIGGYMLSRIPKILAMVTGQNVDEVTSVLSNPKAADIGIREGDEALRRIVNEGSKESRSIFNNFLAGQKLGISKIAQKYTRPISSKEEIMSIFEEAIGEEGITVGKGGLQYPAEFLADPMNNARRISNVYRALLGKGDLDLIKLNSIKQMVGEAAGFVERSGKAKVPVLGRLYHDLDDIIKFRLPIDLSKRYGMLNEVFSANIKLYSDMVKAFNSTDPFTKLAGVFRENADKLRQMVTLYEEKTGKSILPQIAGRAISGEREAAFGLLNPREWIDIVWSPRGQALFVSGVGKVGAKLVPLKNVAGKVTPPLLPKVFD